MMKLRGLVGNGVLVSHMTNHDVLETLAVEVSHGKFVLRVAQARTFKVKFADLLRNYPTNQLYPTTIAFEPNIWKYVGGTVYYNATHDDPTTKTKIFVNSCATRMSRALNYSGAPIHHTASGTVSGADHKWYLFRVNDLDPKMRALFGAPQKLTLGTWRTEIAGKTGVLKFSATWRNATGHFTLWDTDHMVNRDADEGDATDPHVNGVVLGGPLRLRLSLLLLSLALAGRFVGAQQIREWRFPVQHGELRIALEHGPGDRLELDILGPPCVPCASLKEVAGGLAEVVRQMEAMKLDPARVHVIATQIDEPEVRDALAAAALRSEDWNRCMKIAACGGNEIVVDLLNRMGAYQSFAGPWQKFGLTVRVVSAEKVSVERAGLVKGWNPPAGTNAKLQVPVNAHLLIEITKAR